MSDKLTVMEDFKKHPHNFFFWLTQVLIAILITLIGYFSKKELTNISADISTLKDSVVQINQKIVTLELYVSNSDKKLERLDTDVRDNHNKIQSLREQNLILKGRIDKIEATKP